MGTIRDILDDVETILVAQGYTRAQENFNLDRVPASILHKAYTFGSANINPTYISSNVADYAGTTINLLICWEVMGSHNTTRTYVEGYADALDALESLESALVAQQLQANKEEVEFSPYSMVEPPDNPGFLIITIPLAITVLREM